VIDNRVRLIELLDSQLSRKLMAYYIGHSQDAKKASHSSVTVKIAAS
jgi:hypothetical protein